LKTDKVVGFREKTEVIQAIDACAEKHGLNRTNFLRNIVREKIAADSKE
jgi:predicted DNA binding CopG/RHH family protein